MKGYARAASCRTFRRRICLCLISMSTASCPKGSSMGFEHVPAPPVPQRGHGEPRDVPKDNRHVPTQDAGGSGFDRTPTCGRRGKCAGRWGLQLSGLKVHTREAWRGPGAPGTFE